MRFSKVDRLTDLPRAQLDDAVVIVRATLPANECEAAQCCIGPHRALE